MGKYTSESSPQRSPQSRRRHGADEGHAAAGQSLQPEHAFVVQLRGGPATTPGGLQGRVEHVVSGEALRFGSTAELVEFLMRGGVPAPPRPLPRRSSP